MCMHRHLHMCEIDYNCLYKVDCVTANDNNSDNYSRYYLFVKCISMLEHPPGAVQIYNKQWY